jgi:hypothetical protein
MTIKESTLEKTCVACPSQWEATTTCGKSVYIRVRHGFFYVNVDGVRLFEGYPEDVDGAMSTEDMINYVEWNTNLRFI